jgi:hypothetical protein
MSLFVPLFGRDLFGRDLFGRDLFGHAAIRVG